MKTISLKPKLKNSTPDVVAAIEQLREGGTLLFEKGEYHFFEQGCFIGTFAPSNNETGIKNVVFPLLGVSDITVDGGGSTFIFHENTSPFIIRNSKNVTVKNAVLTTHFTPYALMKITDKKDCCFTARFDNTKIPCDAVGGNLIFKAETGDISTLNGKLSMHATNRMLIRYLFAGDCKDSRLGLAAPYVDCRVVRNGDDFVFRYSDDEKAAKCEYDVGETVSINLEERRARDVFFLEKAENTKISNITILRGGGMGIMAQLCHDIEIEKLIVKPADGELITTTADIIHAINCSGKFSVHHSIFHSSLDDACNVHGNYSEITDITDEFVQVRYGHPQHDFLEMYMPGDELTVIDNITLDVVGTFHVKKAEFTDDTGLVQHIYCTDSIPPNCKHGFLVENSKRMPDIHIYKNQSTNIPHWRLSGGGNILVENNTYTDCSMPVYAFDLAMYWYESGRINNLTVKNNTFRHARSERGFIHTGVSGFDGKSTPKIHGNITVTDNIFEGYRSNPYDIHGFKNVLVKNNTCK